MGHHSEAFIGIDTSKLRNAIAIAEGGRGGEVRYVGEIDSADSATRKLVSRLAVKYRSLTFCYEAGPTEYGLYRLNLHRLDFFERFYRLISDPPLPRFSQRDTPNFSGPPGRDAACRVLTREIYYVATL